MPLQSIASLLQRRGVSMFRWPTHSRLSGMQPLHLYLRKFRETCHVDIVCATLWPSRFSLPGFNFRNHGKVFSLQLERWKSCTSQMPPKLGFSTRKAARVGCETCQASNFVWSTLVPNDGAVVPYNLQMLKFKTYSLQKFRLPKEN